MKHILLLLLLTGSFLAAQEASNTLSRITELIKQAQTLLKTQEEKKITLDVGQPQANLIYDQLELELTEYEKGPNPDTDGISEADQALSKLSNYFNLRTSAKELAQQFQDIINTLSAHGESIRGEHLTSKDIANPAKKHETLSYLQHVVSGFGTIDANKIFAMVPYVLNGSYDKAREFIKQILLKLGYVEPSPLNRQRVAEALKESNYEHDVIVVEAPLRTGFSRARAFALPPFSIIILSEKNFNHVSFYEFDLYCEIGYLYYNYALERIIWPIAPVLGPLVFGLFSFHGVLGAILIHAIQKHTEETYRYSRKLNAALFACNKLTKQGHSDMIEWCSNLRAKAPDIAL